MLRVGKGLGFPGVLGIYVGFVLFAAGAGWAAADAGWFAAGGRKLMTSGFGYWSFFISAGAGLGKLESYYAST